MEGLGIMSLIMEIMWNYGMQQWANQEAHDDREDKQEFQSEREDIAYERNINSDMARFDLMKEKGFNPNLAADSILGGNTSTPSSTTGAPASNSPLSAMGSLGQIFGNMHDMVVNSAKRSAEVENIEANTNKTNIEAGIMPRDYQLRVMSTTAQIRAWNASADEAIKHAKLNDEQANLVKEQRLYYGRLSEAKIQTYQAQVAEACSHALLQLEQINTEKSKQKELSTEEAVNNATVQKLNAESRLLDTQQSTEYYKSESARIASEFEKAIGNIPLSADASKQVSKMVADNDFEGVQNFYQTIFATALNQKLGSEYGTMGRFGLPFNLWQGQPNKSLHGNPFGRDDSLLRGYFNPDYLYNE